ncbi:hypothetical protein HDU67_006784 [Dinochytrium kinnereticum]|nr:hypothetical protein HDU67_006784 [Dinochytrium kinnereticum]
MSFRDISLSLPPSDDCEIGELGLSSDVWNAMGLNAMDETLFPYKIITNEDVGNIYVIVKDSIPKLKTLLSTHLESTLLSSPRLPGYIHRESSTPSMTPRKTVFSSSGDADTAINPILTKFINQSLLRYLLRAGPVPKRDDGGVFYAPASPHASTLRSPSRVEEYRQVSVVFVKIWSGGVAGVGVREMQRVIRMFLEALQEEDGPWPQKKEQLAAVKASNAFLNNCLEAKKSHLDHNVETKIRVSIASGPILFSEIGNDNRRDASLLGDVVNVAARMLSIEGMDYRIVCDDDTRTAALDMFQFSSLGSFMFKGKNAALNVWTPHGTIEALDSHPTTAVSLHIGDRTLQRDNAGKLFGCIGYRDQQDLINHNIDGWLSKEGNYSILIQGASGLGKSNLLRLFEHSCMVNGIDTCITKGSEVDQWIPYFGMRALAFLIFRSKSSQSFISSGQHASKFNESLLYGRKSCSSSTTSHTTVSGGNKTSTKGFRDKVIGALSKSSASELADNMKSKDDEAAAEFLRFFGEDEKLTPLLGVLLPQLVLNETNWTSNLDGKARASLVKSLLIRIFNKWVGHGRRTAIIFDDVQWLDLSSLDILYEMVENCSNILLLICSRPIIPASPEALRKTSASPNCRKTVLEGFSKNETGELLLSKLKDQGVLKIDELILEGTHFEILSLILTRGSPLFIEFVVLSLVDNLGKSFGVMPDGLMRFTAMGNDIDTMLISDVGAGIMSQFDKLDANFQSLLRVASVYGQYFSLDDIIAVSSISESVQHLKTVITNYDAFNFLTCSAVTEMSVKFEAAGGNHTNFNQPLIDLDSDGQAKGPELPSFSRSNSYAFRHISITNAIYESMPFSRRIELHGCIAEMLEMSAESAANRRAVLPVIAYHYTRSDNIVQKVNVLEELGQLYLSRFLLSEARATMELLINFVKQSEDVITKTLSKKEAAEILCKERISIWWSVVSHCCSVSILFNEGKKAAEESLKLLGCNIHLDPQSLKKATKKAVMRQAVMFIRTGGGKRLLRGKATNNLSTGKGTKEEQAKSLAFGALFHMGFFDVSTSKEFLGWYMFELLNAKMPTAACNPVEWVVICARAAHGLALKGNKSIAHMYLKSALSIGEKIGEEKHYYGFAPAIVYYLDGDCDSARQHFIAFERYHATRVSICLQAGLASLTGEIDFAYKNLMSYLDIAQALGKFWSTAIPYQVSCYLTHTGNFQEAERFYHICNTFSENLDVIPLVKHLGPIAKAWQDTIFLSSVLGGSKAEVRRIIEEA